VPITSYGTTTEASTTLSGTTTEAPTTESGTTTEAPRTESGTTTEDPTTRPHTTLDFDGLVRSAINKFTDSNSAYQGLLSAVSVNVPGATYTLLNQLDSIVPVYAAFIALGVAVPWFWYNTVELGRMLGTYSTTPYQNVRSTRMPRAVSSTTLDIS
jgi:hypothetical protein